MNFYWRQPYLHHSQKRLSIVNHKRSHHIKHLFSIVVFDNMSSRFTFSACAASDTDSAEMTGPGLVKLNRSILWKYGCPGSFKYCKMTQHYRKTHHKRKPSQVERQTVKSHSACSRTIPISGHVTELFFLVQCLFALSSGLTEVLASLALAMLPLPSRNFGIRLKFMKWPLNPSWISGNDRKVPIYDEKLKFSWNSSFKFQVNFRSRFWTV